MDYQHSFESRGAMSEPPVLRPGQPVGESLRAIAGHLLTEAHDILEDESREPAVAVHDIRKELKRWRAMRRHIAQLRKHYRGNLARRRKQRQALLHWAYDSRNF